MADIDRRSFFRRFGAATALAALAVTTGLEIDDPERLLWTPGAKKIIDLNPTAIPRVILSTPETPLHVSDSQLAHLFEDRVAKYGTSEVSREFAKQHRLFGTGKIVRTGRLAMVTSGGYGEFNLIDGKVQGGPEEQKRFQAIDVPFFSNRKGGWQ